jgi:uncharacterized protein
LTVFLLDVNVLIALCDPGHIHHGLAHTWFHKKDMKSWATCPLTENGFIRVASHPNYPNRPGDAQKTMALLMELTSLPGHHFWPDAIRIGHQILPNQLFTHGGVTDLYLLALAVKNNGKLATLDGRIKTKAIKGGEGALELLAAG